MIRLLLAVTAIHIGLLWSSPGHTEQHSFGSESHEFTLTKEEKAWLAEHPEIHVGVMDAWPPFGFVDSHGKPTGIAVDYVEALNHRLGGVLKLAPGVWEQIYEDVKEKNLDAVMDITPKPHREEFFNFTAPYLDIPHVIVARKDSDYLRNEDSLAGKILALERGFVNVGYFRKNYPHVDIREYRDTRHALDAVVRGEADAYAGNRSVVLYLIGQELIANLEIQGRLRNTSSVLTVGGRKDWPMLTKILDHALADISQEEVRRIQSRWIGRANSAKQLKLTGAEREWLKKHPSIRIAFDENYAPYSFRNEKGEFVGIAVDIAHELAAQVGLELDIYPNGQWKQLYSAALQREVDVIATLVKRPGRENSFEFTRPYLSLSQYIITRNEDQGTIKQKSQLSGKKIALVDGYSTTELILSEIENLEPYTVANLKEALEAVSSGKAQATVGDIGMSNHLFIRSGITNLGFSALYTSKQAKQSIGVRKDWPQLATILDKALESISYQRLTNIYTRWRVPDIVKPEAGFLSVIDELAEEEKAWLKDHPVIRLASDYAWPPFEEIDENGQYKGIAADYIDIIEKKLGIEFVQSPRKPWGQITDMIKNRELDVFTCAMKTRERLGYASFTEPYISNPMVIVTRDDVGYVDGLNGLQDKTIAVEKSYASYELLQDNHPELILLDHPDSRSAMLAVSKGEAFAYIGNIATMSNVVRDLGVTNIKVSGQLPYNFELSLGVRSDWQELVPILQKTLDAISLEEKNKILQKWIAVRIDEPSDYTLVAQIIGALIIGLLAILYWNVVLNKKVKARTSQLMHQAHFDTLTDLPNRFLILDRLSQLINVAQRDKTKVGVIFLDLDDFKKINDTLDHHAGDKILIEAAKRLQSMVRAGDSLGRLGGDEFIALIGNVDDLSDVSPIAEHLLSCFKDPFRVNDREFRLTASVGIAVYPNDGENPSELLRNADSAMYHSKKKGRNTYLYFTEAMNQEVSRRLLIEEHMHDALERGEFEPYYQPKIDISSKKIVGFEVLLRWKNASLGQISPSEFIPIAEQNGLIVPIGEFVMKQSMTTFARWRQNYPQLAHIAVNLSPRQFRDPNLVKFIITTAHESGITSESLELEITEGVLLSEQDYIEDALAVLKRFGIRIAMDDFGTGYSSLSYLRNYQFDVLKIDREFINDITFNKSDRELASATIAMAHNLGLEVVAEGVETEQQLSLLTDEGCDFAQGFFFSKPLPEKEAFALLGSK